MCESPILVENKSRFNDPLRNWDKSVKFPWKDFTSTHIEVPCGHCRECIRAKQNSVVQRVQQESRFNHLFFCTLTYSPETLPRLEVNGRSIRYADTRDLRNCIKMLRKYNAFGMPFRYLSVSELGSLRGRPHFHVLFLFPKAYFPKEKEQYITACDGFASKYSHYFTVLQYWQRNIGKRGHPVWIPLTRYVERFQNGRLRKNYDFHYVNPFLTSNGVEDCGMYVLKYMFKPSDRAVKLRQALSLNLSEEEFSDVWQKVRPKYFASIGFGLNANSIPKDKIFEPDDRIVNKIRENIDSSKGGKYPTYFNEFTGQPQLVSPYYLKRPDIYSYEDRLYFWNQQHSSEEDPIPGDLRPLKLITETDKFRNKYHYEKTQNHCDSVGFDADLDLLD